LENKFIIIIIIAIVSIAGPAIYYFLHTRKVKDFLKQNPNKAMISYSGGQGAAGVHVHQVLSQSMTNEFSRKYPHAGTFSVNAGKVEMEVERVTMSYNPLLKRTTYTFHGKVRKMFTTEAGKKYKVGFNKKNDDFYLIV
jgi:uncharacterized protein YneF (UPF0154 family)